MFNLFASRLTRHDARMIADWIATNAVGQQMSNRDLILDAERILDSAVAHTGYSDYKITAEEVRTIFKQAHHYLTESPEHVLKWVDFTESRRISYETTGILFNDGAYREELRKYLSDDDLLDSVKWKKGD